MRLLLIINNALSLNDPLTLDETSKVKSMANTIENYYKDIYPYLFDNTLSDKDKLKATINNSMKDFPNMQGSGLNFGDMLSDLAVKFGGSAVNSAKVNVKLWNSPCGSHRDLVKLLKLHFGNLQENIGTTISISENILLSSKYNTSQGISKIFNGNEQLLSVINRVYTFVSLLNNTENSLVKDHMIVCDSFIAKIITMVMCGQSYEVLENNKGWNNMSIRLIEGNDKGYIYE